MTTEIDTLRATIADLLPDLAAGSHRDVRVETVAGVATLRMGDDGYGEVAEAVSDREADILVRHGYARDAR